MPHHESPDAGDVRLTLNGDREAFGRLYDRHAGGVRAIVVAVSCEFNAVEDLTQETFLRGYRRLATLQDGAGFRPWIQGIARFVAKERRRELDRNRLHFVTDHDGSISIEDDVQRIERTEQQRRIISAVAELPERERLAVHAYYFHEQSADQAAATIGLSRSGFYAALERGMDRLRNNLGVKLKPSKSTNRKRTR